MTYGRTLRALGLGALTVLLSACIKLDMDFTVHSDDTVSGSVIAGASKQVVNSLGGEQAVRDQARQFLSENQLPAGVEISDYSDDSYTGIRATFDNLALDEVNNRLASRTEQPLIKHESGTFIVDTTLPLSGEAFGVDLGPAAGTGDIRVVVTFPGRVLSHNGHLDGTTVTWTATLGQDLVMQAVSEETGAEAVTGDDGASTALWIGLAALLALAAGLVGFLLYQRSRRAAPAAAAAGSQDTAGTIADYDQPVAGPRYGEATSEDYGTREYEVPATADPKVGSGSGAGSDTSTTAVLSDNGETETPPAGQPPVGQPPAGQPPAGQPPAGQPPVGQPPAGQPPAGQPPEPDARPPADPPPASGSQS